MAAFRAIQTASFIRNQTHTLKLCVAVSEVKSANLEERVAELEAEKAKASQARPPGCRKPFLCAQGKTESTVIDRISRQLKLV